MYGTVRYHDAMHALRTPHYYLKVATLAISEIVVNFNGIFTLYDEKNTTVTMKTLQ